MAWVLELVGDQLAGNVSKEGALGVISAVGTGYYRNKSNNVQIELKKR